MHSCRISLDAGKWSDWLEKGVYRETEMEEGE